MENIKNNRTGTDATFRVGLKDGVLIDWPSIEIKQVFMYSTEQRTFGGRTSFAIDAEDSKVLVVTWPASEQIYLGEHRLVARIEADGVEATYDAVAINQVPFTQDVAEPVTPAPVEVNIVIDSVDTTVIREILAACQEATDRAIRASEGVEDAIARANASAERAEKAVGRAEHAIEVVDEQIVRVENIEKNIAQALVDAELAKHIAEQASATAEVASETAQSASTQATEAIADAHKAIEEAQTAKSISDTATANANAAAANANSKAGLAETAATSANTAAGNANTKAGEANTAAINASNAAQTANTAAINANNKASDAQTAAGEARAAASRVDTAIATANTAAGNADTAATNANNAASEARQAAQTATESAGVLQDKLERGEVIPHLATDLKHPTHQEESFVSRVSQGGMVDVKSIKGNSVVWNQLSTVIEESLITSTTGSFFYYDHGIPSSIPVGHKFIIEGMAKSDCTGTSAIEPISGGKDADSGAAYLNKKDGNYEDVYCIGIAKNAITGIRQYAYNGTFVGIKNVLLHDLTAMGMEDVTTYEEFVARTKDLQIDKTTYNEGEVVNFTAESIGVTGRNIWDEEWRNGYYNNGVLVSGTQRICSKNPIPIMPSTNYYMKESSDVFFMVFYDEGMNFISNVQAKGAFTTLNNARYMHFFSYDNGAIPTYNHDICINLSDPSFNGQYEPYRKASFDCDPSKATDSEGNPLFPDGLCKVNAVYDEMGETRDVKRIGVVNMGELTWRYNSGVFHFVDGYIFPTGQMKIKGGVICPMYPNIDKITPSNMPDKTLQSYNYFSDTVSIIIKDSSYTDAASFKAAMQGVKLFYELASPIVVDHEPRRMFYPTYKGGVESLEGENTTPIKADMGNGYDLCKIVGYLTSKAEK